MTDRRARYEPPSTSQTAFNCPHCSALTQQFWYSVHANALDKDQMPPRVDLARAEEGAKEFEDQQQAQEFLSFAKLVATGSPLLRKNSQYSLYDVYNVSVSRCFNCDKVAIWIYDRLAWPVVSSAPLANPDLPDDVRADYEEAGTLLELSPRGAAALLRLAIQKLCKELGEKGENINDDIASLVKKGLDPRVQKALDVVRVIGNQAVHPGHLDLRDDHATAEKLFGLVNIIADILISQPKHIAEVYGDLPPNALAAIKRRDGRS